MDKKSWFITRYRIVTDNYCGYEVQFKFWWLPFWFQCFWTNTYPNIEEAREAIQKHKKLRKVVEYD